MRGFVPIGSQSGKPLITEHRSLKAVASIRIYLAFASYNKFYTLALAVSTQQEYRVNRKSFTGTTSPLGFTRLSGGKAMRELARTSNTNQKIILLNFKDPSLPLPDT